MYYKINLDTITTEYFVLNLPISADRIMQSEDRQVESQFADCYAMCR